MNEAYEHGTVCCEGYGPEGAAVIVAAYPGADPSLRDAVHAAARAVFASHGGQCGAANSVAYLFNAVGVLHYAALKGLTARALDAGAEDARLLSPAVLEVITDPADLPVVEARLLRSGFKASASFVTRRAARGVKLSPAQQLRMQGLLAGLRALEGVADVYTNAKIPQ